MIQKAVKFLIGCLLLPPVVLKFNSLDEDLDTLEARLISLESRLVHLENLLVSVPKNPEEYYQA